MNALDHGRVTSRPRAWCRSSTVYSVGYSTLGFSQGTDLIMEGGLKIVGS